MAFNGVRISWLMRARNSLLVLFARSAWDLAAKSCSWARTKSVMSALKPTQRCVGLSADITDFVRAQEQLLAAKSQADLANKTKSEFLARMSHEIRTPLNAIVGLGHLLQDTELTCKQRGYLDSINAASDSLLHIVKDRKS